MSNLLSLDEWREQIGYNPWHFWGMSNGELAPVTSQCNTVVKEENWQGTDALGRSSIRRAIEAGEARLRNYMRFSTSPHYVEETLAMPRYPNNLLERRGYAGVDSRWLTVRANEGKIIACGKEVRTLIEAGVAVEYSDEDSDGLDETFKITVTTSVTNADEIELQFVTADLPIGMVSPSDRGAIQPISVTFSGGVATVKGNAWLMVRPILYQGFKPTSVDPAEAINFVTQVDVYRHYCSAGTSLDTAQAVLIWETRPYPYGYWVLSEPNIGSDPAGEAYGLARLGIRDAENGVLDVGQAVYDAATGIWANIDWRYYRPPDRVKIRYLAGAPKENGRVSQRYARLVTAMGAAELTGRICACDSANRELGYWQFDLARTGASQEQFGALGEDDLNNPWGTKRGYTYAFRELKGTRILRGFTP